MNKKWSVLVFFVAILITLTLFCPGVRFAFAAESTGLRLSPPTFEISANPGDTIKNVIRVQNISEKNIRVVVDKRNFTAVGEEGSVGLTEEETSFSLASWMTPGWPEFDLPAKSNISFPFEIRIPLNAEPGGHFGSLIFKICGLLPGQAGAGVSQELGALILLQIAGKTKEEATLESFQVKRSLWEYGPVEFEARVKNEGNVHLKPHGSLSITNVFGKQVANIPIEGRNVLPGAIRKIPFSWDRKNLFGHYVATLSLGYGDKGKALITTTSFWGFPYRVGGIVLTVLFVLGFLLFRARRRISLALRILLGKNV